MRECIAAGTLCSLTLNRIELVLFLMGPALFYIWILQFGDSYQREFSFPVISLEPEANCSPAFQESQFGLNYLWTGLPAFCGIDMAYVRSRKRVIHC